jgi:hypothetical protein
MFAEFTRAKIRFKDPKAGRPWQMVGFGHRGYASGGDSITGPVAGKAIGENFS